MPFPQFFTELYELLRTCSEKDIKILVGESGPESGHMFEAMLKLLGSLGCIEKLPPEKWIFCVGSFNLKTIKKRDNNRDIFYKNDGKRKLGGNGGDSSDFTLMSLNNEEVLAISSKYLKKEKSGGLDIEKMALYAKKYEDDGLIVHFGFCVRNKEDTDAMISRTHKTSKDLADIYKRPTTIVIDQDDLNKAYHRFQEIYRNKSLDSIINTDKIPLRLRMHQTIAEKKTLRLKRDGRKQALWAQICRSGKSYIACGAIIADDGSNYLFITTCPKETIEDGEWIKPFHCLQLQGFNVILLNGKNRKPKLTDKNIILCSKQFLQTKIKKGKDIPWLKKMKFDMRFVDEIHNGGTTELAQKILDYYGKNAFTVDITATYEKAIQKYNIPKDCWILWDLEDINLCKSIDLQSSKDRLEQKHGVNIPVIIEKIGDKNIIEEYSKFPKYFPLTWEIKPEVTQELMTGSSPYGYSQEALFLLKESLTLNEIEGKPEFQNEKENLKMWYSIFGKKDAFGRPDPKFPDNVVFMERIKKICRARGSRFIGEGDMKNTPMIILAFLPVSSNKGENHLNKISEATKNLLEESGDFVDYEIVCTNTKADTLGEGAKRRIEDARNKAQIGGKKGVLVLSGRQCSLGVSFPKCDIVLLLNNSTNFDMIYQMMFRSMTEDKGKNCGFCIDLNIHRSIRTLVNYALSIKPNCHPKEAIKYILEEKIVALNGDHWDPGFGNDLSISSFSKKVYDIYSSQFLKAVDDCLNRFHFCIPISKDSQNLLNETFRNSKSAPRGIAPNTNGEPNSPSIPDGILKTATAGTPKKPTKEDDNKKNPDIKFAHVLKTLVFPILLYTVNIEESSFVEMFNYVKNDKRLYLMLLNLSKLWWGKYFNEQDIESVIDIYKSMEDKKKLDQIIRTVKELFIKHKKNGKELSKLIDKYLVPQETEVQKNGEVSTPWKERQQMLDLFPPCFWKSIKKVFEPCAGKGGFIIDIIDRFMTGLKEIIPDEKLRYKTIVEECLYFCDINSTNIFICKLLIDPDNEYKLNYFEGDSLKLSSGEICSPLANCIQWFDAVISNPPYNSSSGTGTGNGIWQKFTREALNIWIKPNGYLAFVHPPGWRKPNPNGGRFGGLYRLMTQDNQMISLSMYGIDEGRRVFKRGTRYDIYIIQKRPQYKNTDVTDCKGKKMNINMSDFNWLPNFGIDTIQKLLAKPGEEKCEIIHSGVMDPRQKHMEKGGKRTEEYKYPCIHTIRKGGPRYLFSKRNDIGNFGVPKVIFGESVNAIKPVIDGDGQYGMTHHCMAIKINNEDGKLICQSLKSDKMKAFLESCLYSAWHIDWSIFKDLKKDFWKEFI